MELIKEYTPLSTEEINSLNLEIEKLYDLHLKEIGLKLPRVNSAKRYWIIYLYKYLGKAVHKDVISQFVREHVPNAGRDQQIRHLGAQDNYYCLNWKDIFQGEEIPRGYSLLVNLTEPNPKFEIEQHKRDMVLNATDFEDIKQAFLYCCATCGVKEGSIHPITNKKVQLQQGHMDPSLPLELNNIIPQCEYCNQNIYKNDFVFDNHGYPKKIYNPRYILKSDENIQKQMYEILSKKFKGEVK